MTKFFRRKQAASSEGPETDNRPANDDAELINEEIQQLADINRRSQLDDTTMTTDSAAPNRIDPRLTNEALILARLRADMASLPADDSDAIAAAYGSTAQGAITRALKVASTAQGAKTIAAGVASSTQGVSNIAAGTASTAQGYSTTATGLASTAQGIATSALEIAALAEGVSTNASGFASHAEGYLTTASGVASHAEGDNTRASGSDAHAEGYFTVASGDMSHTEGIRTTASSFYSHAEGEESQASASTAHAEGLRTRALGGVSHAEGSQTEASGTVSHAQGILTRAIGTYSHAEGAQTRAEGVGAHAEGNTTIARGEHSHAQGFQTLANGNYSHAEGQNTAAQSTAAHAEGFQSAANGNYSHAEGILTNASGTASHAEGTGTIANGPYTHAEGNSTTTGVQEGAHIMGRYGDATFPYSWHLANGTNADNRSLAAIIRNDGQGIADLGWVTGNADFAEMFETLSGKEIPPGYFVTLKGDKIRKANSSDDFILGVTSAAPAFLGDAEDLRWKDKYIKDEWGRIKYREVVIHEQKDENGNIITPERKEMRPVLNPAWNSDEEYIPRSQRPEWVPVAALGKVLVRDDGTCTPDGYCLPNDEGVATASKRGCRVLKRTGPSQILIWLE